MFPILATLQKNKKPRLFQNQPGFETGSINSPRINPAKPAVKKNMANNRNAPASAAFCPVRTEADPERPKRQDPSTYKQQYSFSFFLPVVFIASTDREARRD
jgi:hypothetical protein